MDRPIKPSRFTDRHAMRIVGLRRRYPRLEALRWIGKQWEDFNAVLRTHHLPAADVAFGVCLEGECVDEVQYLAGIEVDDRFSFPTEFREISLSPQQYAVFAHDGPASSIPQTWSRIRSTWLPTSSYRITSAPDLERYGQGFDPVSCSGDIEIWVPVQAEPLRSGARSEPVRDRTI